MENIPLLVIFSKAGSILATHSYLHVEVVMSQQEVQSRASSLLWWPLLFQDWKPESQDSIFTPATARLRKPTGDQLHRCPSVSTSGRKAGDKEAWLPSFQMLRRAMLRSQGSDDCDRGWTLRW